MKGTGVGIIIFTIDGGMIEQSIRITFPITNNVTEYQVVLLSLKVLKGLREKCINIHSVSLLVVNQIN